jgi:hypothetical protein
VFFRKPNITITITSGSITYTTNTITTTAATRRCAPFPTFFLPDAPVEATIAPH